jgi:predicted MFS family arabinose efflux permease
MRLSFFPKLAGLETAIRIRNIHFLTFTKNYLIFFSLLSHMTGSQFTAYMSMVNLCDILGSFVSGHLQRHVRADQIGLGCAAIILVALVVISVTVYRKERKIKSTISIDQQNQDDHIS